MNNYLEKQNEGIIMDTQYLCTQYLNKYMVCALLCTEQ